MMAGSSHAFIEENTQPVLARGDNVELTGAAQVGPGEVNAGARVCGAQPQATPLRCYRETSAGAPVSFARWAASATATALRPSLPVKTGGSSCRTHRAKLRSSVSTAF